MATMNSGLGGPSGYGENVFSSSPKAEGSNDDGAVAVDVTSVFGGGITFFGETFTDIFINSNGAITFGSATSGLDISGADDFSVPALLPFYSDINIDDGGEIYWDVDPGNGKITITWDAVAPFSGSGTNSFQVVLTDIGGGEMGVEYIYGDIQWGDSSGDPAYAGFTDGGSTDVALEFSGNSASMQSYETNDFDNGDPAGTYSFDTTGGIPDVLIVGGSSGDDTMSLGFVDLAGNTISAGSDIIDGGAGADSIDGDDGDDTILGGSGDDTILSGSTGSTGSISWTAVSPGANLQGTGGQDYFQYNGTAGTSATIRMNNSADAGDGDGVADYLHVTSTDNNITLTVGDFDMGTDKIILSDGFTIASFSDDGSFVDLTVNLDNGNQQFFTLFYDGALDTSSIFTTTLPDPPAASDDDVLDGGDGADTFLLEDDFGADTIIGGEGGTDDDVIDASDLTSAVSVSFSTDETGTVVSGDDTLNFSEIEEFELSGQNDTLTGSGSTQSITADGGSGDDQLTGGAAGDTLLGGADNDLLTGDATNMYEVPAYRLGVDFTVNSGDLDGGGFSTTLSIGSSSTATFLADNGEIGGDVTNEVFSHTDQRIIIDGVSYNVLYDDAIAYTDDATGDTYTFAAIDVDLNDDGSAGTGEDGYYLIQIDGPPVPDGSNLTFSALVDNEPDPLDLSGFEASGDDSLEGGSGHDTLIGGLGADTLAGGAGDDSIEGGDGADSILDGDGDDTILGGLGADSVNVGSGNDSIDLGDGDDSVVFESDPGALGSNTVIGGDGTDELDVGSFNQTGEAGFTGTITDAGFTFTGSGDTITGDGFERFIFTNGGDTIDASATTDGNYYFLRDGSYNGINDDILIAGSGNDTIHSSDGHATLTGGAGDDVFSAINGNKTYLFQDGFGNDTVDSTWDGDTDTADFSGLTTQSVTLTIDGANIGTVTSGADSAIFDPWDTFILSDNADSVDGSLGSKGLEYQAGDGDDTITGGSGADTILGGDGADTLVGGLGNDSLDGGAGADALSGGADDDTIFASAGADTLLGGTGADFLDGGGGDDTFVMEDGFGSDTITGGFDNDRIDGAALTTGITVVLTGAQAGTFSSNGSTATFSQIEAFTLSDLNDSVDNSTQSAAISADGGEGDDTLRGGSQGDTLSGGDGDDLIDGGAGDDFLTTGLGQDTLLGGAGDDTLMNSDGDDSLDGGAGDDSIVATGGEDTLRGGTGADTMEGGDDADTFIIEDSFGNDSITGGEGTTDPGDEDFDTIDLSAMSGSVTVTFTGDEAGTITDGTDIITFSEIEQVITTDQADVVDASSQAGSGGINVDTRDGADTITGGNNADTIQTGTGDDSIDGGGGDDSIDAGAGSDSIAGGSGADTIDAGGADDTLDGGAGDDVLEGGTGDDVITGGAGDDTFAYAVGDGDDTITDFNTGNSGALGDGDNTNNDFIDLGSFYDSMGELRADFDDDGVLNQSDGSDYSDNSQFGANDSLTFQGANRQSFTADNTGVVCFAHDTMILTTKGERPAGGLRPGDQIITRDNGPQPLVMLACRRLDAVQLAQAPASKPILITGGLPGQNAPLTVSPQHGILIGAGANEALVRAKHLIDTTGIKARPKHGCRQITYVHLILEGHQIVFANGAPSESFFPGPRAIGALTSNVRSNLIRYFPELARVGCRPDDAPWTEARSYLRRKDIRQAGGSLMSTLSR